MGLAKRYASHMRIDMANVETAATFEWDGGNVGWGEKPRYPHKLPKGWKWLGTGSSRCAFLGPDGYVYKITRGRDSRQSETEARVSWRERVRKDLPPWVIIPRSYFVESHKVLVMEYIEGTQPRCDIGACECGGAVKGKCWKRQMYSLPYIDTHPVNCLLTDDGKIVMIDLGCEW